MTRVAPSSAFADIPVVDLGQGDRINLGVASLVSRLPKVAEALGALTAALKSGTLPPRLLELVRLRIAFHNQCRSCMSVRYQSAVDDGLTEDAVCSLERPAEAPDLSDAERAALKFADLFATNHLAIDESIYDELRRYLTEDELVELGMHCAVSLGVGRLTATWDVTDDVPEAFRSGDDRVTPWASTGVIASG
ncbi:MAG TPA: carboxymuconolactone decarboxylase family protein [Mycobacterium sp.]|jgi:AhpD family alkylhydroperoxidase